jgi:hypothetical protein
LVLLIAAEFSRAYVVLPFGALYTQYPAMPDDVLASQLNVAECDALEIPAAASDIFAGEFVALLMTETLPLTVSAVVGAKVTSSVAVCPGEMVAPLTPPPVVILPPVTEIPDTFTLELPVFFRLTASVSDFPSVTFPKFKLVGVTESDLVAVTPVAFKSTTSDLSVAVLEKVMLPVTEPVKDDVNFTVQFTLAPAARWIGYAKLHDDLNSDALSVAPEMVSVVVPVFFN